MDQIRSLSQMIEEARKLCASKGKKRVSVAMAEDAGLISAIKEALRARDRQSPARAGVAQSL